MVFQGQINVFQFHNTYDLSFRCICVSVHGISRVFDCFTIQAAMVGGTLRHHRLTMDATVMETGDKIPSDLGS